MSEEKLYAVKNDEGEWMSLDGTQTEIWYSNNPTLFKDKSYAEAQSMGRKAHVVELVEPEKVVLNKEQAKIVDDAHSDEMPAGYIFSKSNDEELLMNAYVNGYTVAKEKKYNVKVPHAVNSYFKKIDANYCIAGDTFYVDLDENLAQFTEAEIEHYGLQDCEKEEVTDDGIR
jgi:hypothetical protein